MNQNDITGYCYFNYENERYRVAIFKGKPSLFAVYKPGFKVNDKATRWRSIFSRLRKRELLQFMEKSGLLKDIYDSTINHEINQEINNEKESD